MSDEQKLPENKTGSIFLYPFVIVSGFAGAILTTINNLQAIYSALGLSASIILIGIGFIGLFVTLKKFSFLNGILFSLIWTLLILLAGLGYYVILTRPVSLTGTLLNNNIEREPISGYMVRLYHYSTGSEFQVRTDNQGNFRFNELSAGEYDIIINDSVIGSGSIESGWRKLLQSDIDEGRFYLNSLGQTVIQGSTSTPTNTITSSDTPIPLTATDTATQTPIPSTATVVPTFTRRPTNTPSPTAIFTGGLFDDFQSAEFEGTYNSRLWIKSEGNTSDAISQSEGVLNLVASDGSGFFLNPKVALANNSIIAVSMWLSDSTDRRSNITLNTWFQDINSYIEFGVYSDDLGRPKIFIMQAGEILYSTNAAFDRWYDIKIEFDVSEKDYTYFVDDQSVLQHTVTSTSIPGISIQFWKDTNSDIAVASIDNVMIDF